MTVSEVRLAIEELRTRTRPEQRTTYERALLALADLVGETISGLESQIPGEMSHWIYDLRDTVRPRLKPTPKDPA